MTFYLLAIGLFVSAMLVFFGKYIKNERMKELEKIRKGSVIREDHFANFAGLSSKGAKQQRRSGILILTDEEIFFLAWLSKVEIRIPLSSVIRVDETKTHAGRWAAYPMFHIIYKNEDGKTDGAAWSVKNREEWAEETIHLTGGDNLSGKSTVSQLP